MSNNKETQEPLMGQPVELEVVGPRRPHRLPARPLCVHNGRNH